MAIELTGTEQPGHGPVDLAAAAALQIALRDRVVLTDDFAALETVAGVDVAWDCSGRRGVAAAAVFRLADLRLVETAMAEAVSDCPYVAGLLAWRELPAMLEVLARLHQPLDLVLCDGHGIAHPRRFGLACHLGLATGLPTIGVAKAPLIVAQAVPGAGRGDWTPLRQGDEIVGAALRTQPHVRPVYVSTGHRVSLARCIALDIDCALGMAIYTGRLDLDELARLYHIGLGGRCLDSEIV